MPPAATAADGDKPKFPVLRTLMNNPSACRKAGSIAFNDVYYSVKFYPYTEAGVDPVFCVVGASEVYVARPSKDDGIEILQHLVEDNDKEVLCTAAWTKDKVTGRPLLAFAGFVGIIKILDVLEGEIVQTLLGHGDEILDLQVSPTDPSILASASTDTSIRLWSLDPAHRKQPCAAILSGEGHKETVLSIAFHECGRYLLSSGMDHVVNLWILPDLPDERTGTDTPTVVRYPHFSTCMIHTNYIDSIVFFGDLILSKAASEHKIVLWRIQNFSSTAPPLPPERAPTTHDFRDTRSAYGGTFDRLMQFSCPETDLFYMQFGLFSKPDLHSTLVMGSVVGKVYFWDLRKVLENGAPRDPFALIKPHSSMQLTNRTAIRQVGWSVGGEYLVAVGDSGMIAIFYKDS